MTVYGWKDGDDIDKDARKNCVLSMQNNILFDLLYLILNISESLVPFVLFSSFDLYLLNSHHFIPSFFIFWRRYQHFQPLFLSLFPSPLMSVSIITFLIHPHLTLNSFHASHLSLSTPRIIIPSISVNTSP